jgi:hypothetical protein
MCLRPRMHARRRGLLTSLIASSNTTFKFVCVAPQGTLSCLVCLRCAVSALNPQRAVHTHRGPNRLQNWHATSLPKANVSRFFLISRFVFEVAGKIT